MFEKWKKKIEMAEYFFGNLKSFAEEANGFAYIPMEKKSAMRANLDGFFFELISAKDFFLQEMNDYFLVGLKKDDATKLSLLKKSMTGDIRIKALAVVNSMEKHLIDKSTWQWKINNYRNSATHRNLVSEGFESRPEWTDVKVFLYNDPEEPHQGRANIEILPYCEESLKNTKEWLENLQAQLGLM